MNPILTKNYLADGAVTEYRIAKFGSADGLVAQADADTDQGIGVFDHDADDGGRVDVVRLGLMDIEYGGVVTRGDELTIDASGRAVARSATTQTRIGFAEVSGVSGDIGKAMLQPDGTD